jgi:hypothetical protein
VEARGNVAGSPKTNDLIAECCLNPVTGPVVSPKAGGAGISTRVLAFLDHGKAVVLAQGRRQSETVGDNLAREQCLHVYIDISLRNVLEEIVNHRAGRGMVYRNRRC